MHLTTFICICCLVLAASDLCELRLLSLELNYNWQIILFISGYKSLAISSGPTIDVFPFMV